MRFKCFSITFLTKLTDPQEDRLIVELRDFIKRQQGEIDRLIWKLDNHQEFKIMRKTPGLKNQVEGVHLGLGRLRHMLPKFIQLEKKDPWTYILYVAEAEMAGRKIDMKVLGHTIKADLGRSVDAKSMMKDIEEKVFPLMQIGKNDYNIAEYETEMEVQS